MHLQRHTVTLDAGFYAQGGELFRAQHDRTGFAALGALEIGDEPVDVVEQVDGLLGLPELAHGLAGLVGHAMPGFAVGDLDHAAALSAVQAWPMAQVGKSTAVRCRLNRDRVFTQSMV